jgi:hypothetical protein
MRSHLSSTTSSSGASRKAITIRSLLGGTGGGLPIMPKQGGGSKPQPGATLMMVPGLSAPL